MKVRRGKNSGLRWISRQKNQISSQTSNFTHGSFSNSNLVIWVSKPLSKKFWKIKFLKNLKCCIVFKKRYYSILEIKTFVAWNIIFQLYGGSDAWDSHTFQILRFISVTFFRLFSDFFSERYKRRSVNAWSTNSGEQHEGREIEKMNTFEKYWTFYLRETSAIRV